METPRVSVVMPTYNHERFVGEAIESVLAQEAGFALELLIGEDCSTDSTREIVQRYAEARPDVIRLRLAEQNRGPKANFVDLFQQCRGEFLTILEGDDYWTSPHKLRLQVEALEARPDWVGCFHPARCKYEGGQSGPEFFPPNWNRSEATVDDLLTDYFIPASGSMLRRSVLELPDWFAELPTVGDWPLHLIAAEKGPIGFLPEAMSVYRINGLGVWTGRSTVERLVPLSEMMSYVDHHFGGRRRGAIEAYRAGILKWLCLQADALVLVQRELASTRQALDATQTEVLELHHLRTVQQELEATRQAFDTYKAEVSQMHSLRSVQEELEATRQALDDCQSELLQLHSLRSVQQELEATQQTLDTYKSEVAQLHALRSVQHELEATRQSLDVYKTEVLQLHGRFDDLARRRLSSRLNRAWAKFVRHLPRNGRAPKSRDAAPATPSEKRDAA